MFKTEVLVAGRVPSRELTYPTWGKGKSSSKVPTGMGYVNFQEGRSRTSRNWHCTQIHHFSPPTNQPHLLPFKVVSRCTCDPGWLSDYPTILAGLEYDLLGGFLIDPCVSQKYGASQLESFPFLINGGGEILKKYLKPPPTYELLQTAAFSKR